MLYLRACHFAFRDDLESHGIFADTKRCGGMRRVLCWVSAATSRDAQLRNLPVEDLLREEWVYFASKTSSERGYLLAISSMAAFLHSPLQGSYTASNMRQHPLELRHPGVGLGSAHPTFFMPRLMDEVIADPAGNLLWGGNEKGLWKITPGSRSSGTS